MLTMVEVHNDSPEAIAARLTRLREVLRQNKAGMAILLEIHPQRWWNIEKSGLLSTQVAQLLVQKIHGLSWDWLRQGRADGLSLKMAQMLGEVGGPSNNSPVASPDLPRGESGKSRKVSTKTRA